MKILNFLIFLVVFGLSSFLTLVSILKLAEEFTLKNSLLNAFSYLILLTSVHFNRKYLKRFYPKNKDN